MPGNTHWITRFAISAISALFLFGCGDSAPDGATQGPPPSGVSVAVVESRDITLWDEFSGRIEAVNTVELRPRVSGYLSAVHFTEGSIVEKDALLFSIDDREYRAAMAAAEADVVSAETRMALAEGERDRGEKLRQAQAISSEAQERRAGEYRQARADLARAKAGLETAKLNLSFTEIRAPIAGRIGAANVREGNLVNPADMMLATLVSIDPIHVVFEGDERIYLKYQARALEGGRPSSRAAPNPVRVGLSSDTDYPYIGKMNFVDNTLNPSTGTIQGRAILDNPDGFLIPGLFARVQLRGLSTEGALLINDVAVLTDQDRKYVYVVTEDNRALRRDVTLGREVDGLRVVTEGLEAGERVIVNGTRKIFFSGAPVSPTEVPMDDPMRASADGAG
ncbi:MAG: efflux RND transporter periplasmic adaptor subunit [Woeseiaceae bacterium]